MPLDPNVKPDGYQPPTSAEELIERYKNGERYFVGAQLEGEEFPENTDLSGANFYKANLNGVSFFKANLKETSFTRTYLDKAVFIESQLIGANFDNASLFGAFFCLVDLKKISFKSANLKASTMEHIDLEEVDLFCANLELAGLDYANLTGAKMEEAKLERAIIENANLERAILYNTKLDGAILTNANLKDANLEKASLEGAYLSKANLRGANLFGANVADANLVGCDFRETTLTKIKYSTCGPWKKPKKQIYQGIKISTAEGNPIFRRYAMDQDFIEQFHNEHPKLSFFWRVSCGYGQSLGMLLGWCFIIAMIFGGIYLYNIDSFDTPCTWECQSCVPQKNCHYVLTPFYFSVVTLTTLGFGDVTPLSLGMQIAVMLEVIAGYIMLGLLISILANKVARRAG